MENSQSRRPAESQKATPSSSALKLHDQSRIAVLGGGPAGSFFSYYLLDMADRIGIKPRVDIYESKEFSKFGPTSCNYCGGIISESLVQILAAEGITIPEKVIQRGIDSYLLHTDAGSVRIDLPLHEKRIASVYRGGGPKGTTETIWTSFDGFLQDIALDKGANLVARRVDKIELSGDRPVIKSRDFTSEPYDLVVGAVGVNTSGMKIFENLGIGYNAPQTRQTYLCEFPLGADLVEKHFGTSMNVFLLNIPHLEFAALIPKGNFVTLCLLGDKIDKELVHAFLSAPEVVRCFPDGMDLAKSHSCLCFPRINIQTAVRPFANRFVMVGDCAATRLFKDGIGAAYVTAKAAASTAVFQGISSRDFEKHYWPKCKRINSDNGIGKFVFAATSIIQKLTFVKRGILRLTAREQGHNENKRRLSGVLWDTFTGSASYRDILGRMFNPLLALRLAAETFSGLFSFNRGDVMTQSMQSVAGLGKTYEAGDTIVKQGDVGDCMFVVQTGKVEVIQELNGRETRLAVLSKDDFFGEMSLFEKERRSATVRALGSVRVLTIDKRTLLGRIQTDPTLAFRLLQAMSLRMRKMDEQLTRIKSCDRRNWDTRPEVYAPAGT